MRVGLSQGHIVLDESWVPQNWGSASLGRVETTEDIQVMSVSFLRNEFSLTALQPKFPFCLILGLNEPAE